MTRQHKPSQAVARTSRLFCAGLSPECVLIITIATKNKKKVFAMKQNLIIIVFKIM